MSENEDKPKQKGIQLGRGLDPSSLTSIARMAVKLQESARLISTYQPEIIKHAIAAAKIIKDAEAIMGRSAALSLYAPNFSRTSGLYGEITKGLYDVEEVIDVIPEELEDESSEIQPAVKQELLGQIREMKNELNSLRQRMETLEQEKSKKIDSIEYPNSVAHFRGWMDRFLALNGKIFKGKIGTHPIDYNIGYFTPAQTTTREVWNVYIDSRIVIDGKVPGNTYFGMILATEDQPNRTIIDFIDGQCYQRTSLPTTRSSEPPVFGSAHLASREPIGETFIKIAEWITEGLGKNSVLTKLPEEPQTQNLTDWFDYYYKVKPKLRIKMEYIADKTGLAVSTVYKEHTLYKNSHDIQKRKTLVRKSKKK